MGKQLIAKKENAVYESGAQHRTANPPSPVSNQLWINTTTRKLSYFDGVIKDIQQGYLEDNAPDLLLEVPLLNVDWSLGTVFRKQNLSGTVNFTFSNLVDGKTIVLVALSATLAGSTINLPVGTKLDPADNYVLPQGTGIAIEISRINGVTYAKIIFRAEVTEWPSGSQGDLTILNGQTVNVTAGSILDYENITINAGGTLNIQGGLSGAITLIGVRSNLIINGTIRGNDGLFGSGTFSVITPRGESVSRSVVQQAAGKGGSGETRSTSGGAGGPGGSLGYGGGGGGSGSTPGSWAAGRAGGVDNNPPTATGPSALGAPAPGNATLGNGTAAVAGGSSPSAHNARPGGGSGGGRGAASEPGYRNAGGAGGAFKGRHGLHVYIFCLGTISGSGSVNLAGQNGFNGGNGSPPAIGRGGAGGGGAGGNGGALWVRNPAPFTVPYSVSNGNGGSAGANTATSPGAAGGNPGVAGVFDQAPAV